VGSIGIGELVMIGTILLLVIAIPLAVVVIVLSQKKKS